MTEADGLYYRPPWYPDKDPFHNPWFIVSVTTRKTYYGVWCDSLPKGELIQLIKEYRVQQDEA